MENIDNQTLLDDASTGGTISLVMTLRTPRRRISPRTKRRYRAIRNFLRRALGNPSQSDIRINSSIAFNVTDLKHKIVGIEQELQNVSKHCQDIECLNCNTRRQTESQLNRSSIDEKDSRFQIDCSHRDLKDSETKIIYKDHHYLDSKSSLLRKPVHNNEIQIMDSMTTILPRTKQQNSYERHRNKNKRSKVAVKHVPYEDQFNEPLTQLHTRSVYENINSSNADQKNFYRGSKSHTRHRNRKITELRDFETTKQRSTEKNKWHKSKSPIRHHEEILHGNVKTNIDQDFIADIIKRQYKPIKLFGNRASDISQFTVPICRDQEFAVRENLQEDPELCSCCIRDQIHPMRNRNTVPRDIRSLCDTRLYRHKRRQRSRHKHNKYVDLYNDETLYDLVPVKEKSSPKSRRKFYHDNLLPYEYDCYNEVPPSPRSQRPKLNLRAQYFNEYNDYMLHVNPKHVKAPMKYCQENIKGNECGSLDNDYTRLSLEKEASHRPIVLPKNYKNLFPNPKHLNELNNSGIKDITLNKSHDTSNSEDKTDKALFEIKNILQNFLQEIKKDSTATQCDNPEIQVNNDGTGNFGNIDIHPSNFTNYPIPNSAVYNIPPPFMTSFTNPCCYPVMPMCPMNGLQNGYVVPSPSFTCPECNHSADKSQDAQNDTTHDIETKKANTETDELIKEIYNMVINKPNQIRSRHKLKENTVTSAEAKFLTSRSVGDSSCTSKHDAKVGTAKLRCYSKSCEAIGSKIISDVTNTTYSDTVIDKMSLEATRSISGIFDLGIASETSITDKNKKTRLVKMLRGLFKKKKKDDIDFTENEHTHGPKQHMKPPFRQDITSYMMHGQEYYHNPPSSPAKHHHYHPPPLNYGYGEPHGYDPRSMSPSPDMYSHHRVHNQTIYEHPYPQPSAPPHPHSFDPYSSMHPPLCLKEIEVKSTGTQSERKLSFFRKFTKKTQPLKKIASSDESNQRHSSTQTVQDKPQKFSWRNPRPKEEKPKFSWLNPQPDNTPKFSWLNPQPNKAPKFSWKNPSPSPLSRRPFNFKKPPPKRNTNFFNWNSDGFAKNMDALNFQYNTQKKLAEGDINMRNAILKKMFYKRNPFSPRNLIVRTLMGKDKSSYGEPLAAASYKPKLFF